MPDSHPDRRQEKKAQSRTRILHEAAMAIRGEGTERVSVAAVMARAGMTVGGFYAHFASKDDLIAQAVTHMFEDRYARFLSHLDTGSPRETLDRFLKNYLSPRHRDAADRGCPIPALAGEFGRLSDPVRAAFIAGMDRLTTALTILLASAGHTDADALAHSVLAEMAGAISLARIQPDKDKADAMLAASRIRIRERLALETIGLRD